MYRFMLSARWLGFAVFVALFAGLTIRLGFWQMDRYHQRGEENRVVAANLDSAPVGIDAIDGDGRTPTSEDEWKRVEVRGTYDVDKQVTVKYQTRDAGPGVDVVTPLVLESGRAVLVDRGWTASQNSGQSITEVPAPPTGPVTVVGWWREDSGAKDSAVVPSRGQVRAVSSEGIGTTTDYDLHRGFLDLRTQDPAPSRDDALVAEPRPSLGIGPSLFYAWQWWFFAAMAITGYFYFAYAEAHPKPRRGSAVKGERRPTPTSV
ncbi:SURF1 family protein [Solicola sp. PLA-1-18]|uniref:SURF1 family cytochrome oxidase biogenesis protein n=1 Tax=Solicola sp. PLA-1-18 TaxID=3380532 RepID=UPI003B767ECF